MHEMRNNGSIKKIFHDTERGGIDENQSAIFLGRTPILDLFFRATVSYASFELPGKDLTSKMRCSVIDSSRVRLVIGCHLVKTLVPPLFLPCPDGIFG